MKDLNQITITGNLGGDCKLRYMASGTAVGNFSVACNKATPDKTVASGFRTTTQWFAVSLWGDAAERYADRLVKGVKILVTGSVSSTEYTDRNGEFKFNIEISARDVMLLGQTRIERDIDPNTQEEYDGAEEKRFLSGKPEEVGTPFSQTTSPLDQKGQLVSFMETKRVAEAKAALAKAMYAKSNTGHKERGRPEDLPF